MMNNITRAETLFAHIDHFSFAPEKPILMNIELHFSQGKVLYISGPNGSGKTTLLLCSLGVYPYLRGGNFKGHILFLNNGCMTSLTEDTLSNLHRQSIYVSQDPEASLFTATVLDELILYLTARGQEYNKALKQIRLLAEKTGLSQILFRRIISLSEGEKQLVGALTASIANAQLVFLDEPFSMLDRESADILRRALSHLIERGCSLAITQIPAENLNGQQKNIILRSADYIDLPSNYGDYFSATCLPLLNNILASRCLDQLAESIDYVPVLELDEIEYWYDHEWSIIPQSHTIYGGNIVLFYGPNGSGKSTLLRLIGGIHKPRKGAITLNNCEVTAKNMRPNRISYVPQNPEHSILAESIEDEFALNYKMIDQPEKRIAVLRSLWLNIWGPEVSLNMNPRFLSYGQKKLLSILSAGLAADAIIIDEPFLGLDSVRIAWVIAILETLRRNGRIVVVSGYDAEMPGLNTLPFKLGTY